MLCRRKVIFLTLRCQYLCGLFDTVKYSSFNRNTNVPKLIMAQSRITSFFQSSGVSVNGKKDVPSSQCNGVSEGINKRKTCESDEDNEIIRTDKKKRIRKLSESESGGEEEISDVNGSELSSKSDVDVLDKSDKKISRTTECLNADDKPEVKEERLLNDTTSSSDEKRQVTHAKKLNNNTPAKSIIKKSKKNSKKIKSKATDSREVGKSDDDKNGLKKSKQDKKKSESKKRINKMNGRKQKDSNSNNSKGINSEVSNSRIKTDNKKSKVKDGDRDEDGGQKSSPTKSTSVASKKTIARHKIKAALVGDTSSSCGSSDEQTEEDKHLTEGDTGDDKSADKKEISLKSTTLSASNYYPNKSDYHPINDTIWKHGEPVPYLALAGTFEKIEDISARLKIIDILSNYFRSVILLSPQDLLPSIYLCLNKLGPAYEGLELGVADTYLMKAIAQCTGRNLKQIKSDFTKTGDLGIIAENSRTNQRTMFQPAALTVQSVFKKLNEIATLGGHASVTKKIDKIQALFVACKPCEARYVIRSLAGKLRIGLAEQSVLQALAVACVKTPPTQRYPPEVLDVSKKISKEDFKKSVDEQALIIKTTHCECPNYDLIIPVLLSDGVTALPEKCKLTAGIPLKPMLAQPTKCIDDIFQQFDGSNFTCEWKYDGERAQIHVCEDGTVKIYSRNMENNTSKYPDITSKLRTALKPEVKSCIIDAEAVAWDQTKKCIMPFQVLSTRKRKDASEDDIKVQVRVFMFDVLYLNGTSLVDKPLAERRELLKNNLVEIEDKFSFVTHLDTNTLEEVQDFLEESVKGNCEGLMVKSLQVEAEYKIAKRSRSWLKLKKDYLQGVGDTLDLVVLGGYLGKGKRTGLYGGFLLACYDTETEQYQSICKIGTGFSDESLALHAQFLKQHLINEPRPYYQYHESLIPDHWFDAVQVWEIKCADLSLSPIHRAAIGIIDPEKGISLRFPRYLRVRGDKLVEDATSAHQIAELYSNQDQIKNQSKTSKVNEEDFY